MADNYLEKRYEEVFGNGAARKTSRHTSPSLNTLLVKNRSIRRFRQEAEVPYEHLRTIVEVNTRIASAMNRQALRFMIVRGVPGAESSDNADAARYEALCRMYCRRPDKRVPPSAFIVVLSVLPEDRYIDIDLGISLQSMSLKAVELGYNCLMIGSFPQEELDSVLFPSRQPHPAPIAVLGVGKSDESAFLRPLDLPEDDMPYRQVASEGILTPYNKDGVHYVPKLPLERLLI